MFPNQPYQETALLKRIADGDHAAFQTFFHLHYTGLAFFAQTIVGEMTDAEDLVQDAFVRLWEKRDTLKEQGNLRSFLYTVVKNACLDFLRRAAHRSARQEEFIYLVEKDGAFLESAVLKEELLQLVLVEIEALPEKYRRVIELIFLEGASYKEISARLEIPEPAIRKQKERALKMLNQAVLKRTDLPIVLITAQLFFLSDFVTSR